MRKKIPSFFKNRSGMTLVEVVIASFVMISVGVVMLFLIVNTQGTHLTESRRLDMQQAARLFEQVFKDQVRGAGSILTMMHTQSFLAAQPPFTGILPFNNAHYPDGVLLAAGDPQAVTWLNQAFTPGATDIFLNTVLRADNDLPAWEVGDVGLVMRADAFYLFRVEEVNLDDSSLQIRNSSVYYSGLLDTDNYNDPLDEQLGVFGNLVTYPQEESPVVRLNYFSIYLVYDSDDGLRSLTLTTDCQDLADVLDPDNHSDLRAVPVVPNIEDFQITWITRDDPAQFWADGNEHPNPCPDPLIQLCLDFHNLFRDGNIASALVSVLYRTAEEEHYRGGGLVYPKPPMGDRPQETIGPARFRYLFIESEIQVRNNHIIY